MRYFCSLFDLSAPQFHLFINGKTRDRSVIGGLIHIIIMLMIVLTGAFTFSSFLKQENRNIVINSGNCKLDSIISEKDPKRTMQKIKISVDNEISKYHSLVVTGNFTGKEKRYYMERDPNDTLFTLDISNFQLTPKSFFISFPRCTFINPDSPNCNKNETEYEALLLREELSYFISMKIETTIIDPFSKDSTIFSMIPLEKPVYLNSKRGVYYTINLSTVIIEQHNGWLKSSPPNNTMVFSVSSLNQESSEELHWNDFSYSIMVTISEDFVTIYQITYDDLFTCFSYIGGMSNCISFFLLIYRIIASNCTDIFLMNSNFFLNKENKKTQKTFPEFTSQTFKKEMLIPHESLNKSAQSGIIKKRNYFCLKYCKCLNKKENVYQQFKWILDIQYLIRIYLQFHILKNFLLTKNQVNFLNTLSIHSKINVESGFNLKNMYFVKKGNKAERLNMINEAKHKFLNKEEPFDKSDEPYPLEYEKSMDKKMANCNDYLTLN